MKGGGQLPATQMAPRGPSWFVVAAALMAGGAGACVVDDEAPARPLLGAATDRQGSAAVAGLGLRATPRSRAELPTTSGELALSNLTSQIDGISRALARIEPVAVTKPARLVKASLAPAPGSPWDVARNPEAASRLAFLLFLRAQIVGSVSDLERAGDLVADIVSKGPNSPAALQLAATSAMAFHRFGEARTALERAEKGGANPRELETTRAALLQATGDLEAVLPTLRDQVRRMPGTESLSPLAVLEAERGRIQDAARLFAEAQDVYRNVSPFPIAFLYFHEGLMWLREGKIAEARRLFEAAVDRLPAYAPAVSHLAQVLASSGDRKRAIALLRTLLATSDDPEHKALLADLVQAEGGRAEAVTLRAAAKARFEELLVRHPEAFADHAARFFMGEGHDPGRALGLAKMNLANRPTREAMQLMVEAALAAGDKAVSCSMAATLARGPYVARSARILLARAFEACGRGQEVEAQLAAAGLTRAALTTTSDTVHTH